MYYNNILIIYIIYVLTQIFIAWQIDKASSGKVKKVMTVYPISQFDFESSSFHSLNSMGIHLLTSNVFCKLYLNCNRAI